MAIQSTARDIMTPTVISAKVDMVLADVAKLLLRWHISGVPVVDDEGKLKGIITEHDVVKFMVSGRTESAKAGEIMTKDVESYGPDTPLADIINHFAARRLRRIPVVEDGKVIGIISRRDIIREMDRIDEPL